MSINSYRIDEEYDFVVDYFLIKGGWYKILFSICYRTALTAIVKDYREMLMHNFCTSIPYLDMNTFWISWCTHCVHGNHSTLL